MNVPNGKKCDVCDAPNTDERGWLMAVTVPPTPDAPGEVAIAFGPIDSEVRDPSHHVEHICSHACASVRFSRWLGDLIN